MAFPLLPPSRPLPTGKLADGDFVSPAFNRLISLVHLDRRNHTFAP